MASHAEPVGEAQDPHCLHADRAASLLAGAPWRRLLVVGDTDATGRGEPVPGYRRAGWADRVAEALRTVRPSAAYLNLGHRDLPASAVRARQLGQALEFRGDLAVVAAGGDDAFRASFDIDTVGAELGRIIRPLRDAGCDVLTVGWFDAAGAGAPQARGKDAPGNRLRQLAERTHAVSMQHGGIHVDLTAHPAGKRPGLRGADGRRLTMRGHAIVAATVVRALGAHLGSLREWA
ncbi:SGNH/GDSL hydrolase family protein [Streptomyces sp. NPDC002809]|uniref:SGNH/GDSL hydrolase family protein n=1 Tax=Streptomyces sp. NPDC002809 TaxID=3154433 RepID=UPI003326E2D5